MNLPPILCALTTGRMDALICSLSQNLILTVPSKQAQDDSVFAGYSRIVRSTLFIIVNCIGFHCAITHEGIT